MKVIFLDVDGVLNTPAIIQEFDNKTVGREFLERLAVIVKRTGAVLVLSSTWRLYDEWHEAIKRQLLDVGLALHDKTECINFAERCEEIREWLNRHPEVKRFAVIDDWFDASLGHSFFQTDDEIGLTVEIQNAVIEHLNTA